MEERDHSAHFAEKMRRGGLPEIAIRQFCIYYRMLVNNEAGYIPSAEAQPVPAAPTYAGLGEDYAAAGKAVLDKVVIWKLNGGLGTSMGMHGAKSELAVKGALTFLDIIIRQVLQQRKEYGVRLPLMLMDSCHTPGESAAVLADYPQLEQDLPLRVLQPRVPKVRARDLMPVEWPDDPEKEWCPPGHGDLYTSLTYSGALAQMVASGYEYAFVSNADNLGAVVDPRILGYAVRRQVPFLMEVTARTSADRKGGHLARRPDGRLMVREVAQCPEVEAEDFQDTERYRYFNTNSLWIHLPTLQAVVDAQGGALTLPLIRNLKTVDPLDPESPQVYHLETAMGAALDLFSGSEALAVPRSRFVPVKKTHDLLLLWSDAYRLTPDYRLRLATHGVGFDAYVPPVVELDERYYRTVEDIKRHFGAGAPSLALCRRLRVTGDVYFGRDVVVKGHVHVINERSSPMWIPDSTVLQGEVRRQSFRPRWAERPHDGGVDVYSFPLAG